MPLFRNHFHPRSIVQWPPWVIGLLLTAASLLRGSGRTTLSGIFILAAVSVGIIKSVHAALAEKQDTVLERAAFAGVLSALVIGIGVAVLRVSPLPSVTAVQVADKKEPKTNPEPSSAPQPSSSGSGASLATPPPRSKSEKSKEIKSIIAGADKSTPREEQKPPQTPLNGDLQLRVSVNGYAFSPKGLPLNFYANIINPSRTDPVLLDFFIQIKFKGDASINDHPARGWQGSVSYREKPPYANPGFRIDPLSEREGQFESVGEDNAVFDREAEHEILLVIEDRISGKRTARPLTRWTGTTIPHRIIATQNYK
jgi:hypothetical protein